MKKILIIATCIILISGGIYLLFTKIINNKRTNKSYGNLAKNESYPEFYQDGTLRQEFELLYNDHAIDKLIDFLIKRIDEGLGDPATYMILLQLIENPNNSMGGKEERDILYNKYLTKGIKDFPHSQTLEVIDMVRNIKNENPDEFEKTSITSNESDTHEIETIKMLKKLKERDPDFIKNYKFYSPDDYEKYRKYVEN